MKSKTVLINVLDMSACQDCKIAGSLCVPRNQLESYAAKFSKDTEIILYCAHSNCPQSRLAWHILHDAGFTNIYAYEGGMREWFQKKYPTEGACTMDYIHAPLESARDEDPQVKTISAQELYKKLFS
jgi:rhodanese-related sulfurtransferase